MASTVPDWAKRRAADGISNDPGTRAIWMSEDFAPLRRKQSSAPCSKRSVMNEFHRLTTMPKRIPLAFNSPSMELGRDFEGSLKAQKPTRKFLSNCTAKRRDFQEVSSISPISPEAPRECFFAV